MAFGYHKRKRQKKELKQERERLAQDRQRLMEDVNKSDIDQDRAAQDAAKAAEERKRAREEGRKYAEELFSRDVEGLTPGQRRSYSETGRRNIGRDIQGAQRQLAAQQGRRGLRGGAAYAQQADLARAGAEATGRLESDLSNLDADLALKRLAAMFNIEQGEAAQSQLDKQLAVDEQRAEQERRRQRYLQEQYDRIFSRI
jgi:hypothetical protein